MIRQRCPFAASACLLFASFLIHPADAFAKDVAPDWVKQAAAQKPSEHLSDADAVVLLEDRTYTLSPDGSMTEHVRKAVRILRPQGRRYGTMAAHYDAASKIRSMHMWSIGADGREYALKDSELVEEGAFEGFELYSDSRVRIGHAAAMEVGAVAAVEYEIQSRPFENDIVWMPGSDIPTARERLSLELPSGYTYKANWKGGPKAAAVDAEHGRTLWEVTDLDALVSRDHVPLAPNEIALAPRMDIFYQGPMVNGPYGGMAADWPGIGQWYERLAKDRNQPDAAIAAKARELVAGRQDFRGKLEAIANFVQGRIRYVAIEIGVGGLQPHPAADTFRARYGDCKDKATLLSAMLSAVGIRSTWVLVDTRRGFIASTAPSLAGNHMIAAVELPAGESASGLHSVITAGSGKRYLLFDPTWEKTPFGQIESELQGGDALLVDGAQSQAIRLPVLPPEENIVARKAVLQLRADGALSGTVEESQSGDIASRRRYLFSGGTEKEQRESLDHALSRDLGAFSIGDLRVANLSDLQKPLVLSYTLQAPQFAQEMGPLLTVRPHVLGQESFPVDHHPRKLPIDLGRTREVHDDFTIALPAGFQMDELPAPVDLDLGFASYRSRTEAEGQNLHYTRSLSVREIVLPAERYADVQKLARTIATDEQESAVLKRTKQ